MQLECGHKSFLDYAKINVNIGSLLFCVKQLKANIELQCIAILANHEKYTG